MAKVAEGEMSSCRVLVDEVHRIKEGLVQAGHNGREVSQMRFWYRGHALPDWRLLPSGLRPPFDKDQGRLQTMLHEFRAEATVIHENPPRHDDARQWLFLMRHYEMPTLLIDWTRSPLAALYFAVDGPSEAADQDGALWMVRPGVWNRFAVPQSGERGRDRLLEAYSNELNGLFQVHFDRRGLHDEEEAARWIAAIEPVYNSRRMIAQQSVFTLHGPCSQPMEIVHESFAEPCLWRWRIPANKKGDLQQELHDLGIQRSVLFPDLDNLSRCIKTRYEVSAATLGQKSTRRGRGDVPNSEVSAAALGEKTKEDPWTNNGSGSAPPSDITAGGLGGVVHGPDLESAQNDRDDFHEGQATGSSYVS